MLLVSGTKKLALGKKTIVMGVLNITPDSFSDGGSYFNDAEAALKRAEAMIAEGADIIDVGGESTRPGSDAVSAEEEISRVIPVIKKLRAKLGDAVWVSIDTNKGDVAEAALEAGADILNSLGGIGSDKKLVEVVKKYECPFVVYHIKGTPKTMQEGEIAYGDIIEEIKNFFKEQISLCEQAGISRREIILDPGIGFGKTVEQNVAIIKRLGEFSDLGCPVLIGVSRKSHLGAILQAELSLPEIPLPLERIEAGLAETAIAVLNGAHIVRTHDVSATKKFLIILDHVRNS